MCGCEHKLPESIHRSTQLAWYERIGFFGFLFFVPVGSFIVYKFLMFMGFYEKLFR
jgi:hypothetical protein